MVLAGEPEAPVSDPRVSVRPAEGRDVAFVIACLAEAFGYPADTLGEEEAASPRETLRGHARHRASTASPSERSRVER